jgi:hypothetical protein
MDYAEVALIISIADNVRDDYLNISKIISFYALFLSHFTPNLPQFNSPFRLLNSLASANNLFLCPK